MGEQRAVGTKDELLAGQPAEALDEAAFDLADVDGRVDGAAGVVKDVDAQQAVFAGEGVDGDLAQRGAVGEVVEGPAAHGAGVVAELGGGVEAGVPQLHAGQPGVERDLGEGGVEAGGAHAAGLEAHAGRLDARLAGDEGRQPPADRPAGGLGGLAVEVAARRGGGGRGVGHAGGVGGRQAHVAHRQAELGGDDLAHLGVEALAHLGAAVADAHAAVLIHMHQRAGLVEEGVGEGDAELDRGERQPALEHLARGVEGGDFGAAPGVVGVAHQAGHQRGDDVVFDAHPVGGDVAPRPGVEVGAAHRQRV